MVLVPFAPKSAPLPAPTPMAPGLDANLIKDTTTASFVADVIQASQTVPILVDFWATWCGPCKQLGPLLEKIVRESKGAVRLVKVDIDKNQELASQLRIQSVPAVYAFFGGQPVDGFVGALPESQLRQFVARLVKLTGAAPGGEHDELAKVLAIAADTLQQGEAIEALKLYQEIRAAVPDNTTAYLGEIKALLQTGDLKGAQSLFDTATDEIKRDKEYAGVKSALELAAQGQGTGDIAALEAKLAAAPNDPQARLDLATALFAAGKAELAVDHLLQLVDKHRAWNEEAARKQLVKILEALGFDHPLAKDARRRMSAIMFR